MIQTCILAHRGKTSSQKFEVELLKSKLFKVQKINRS